VAWLRRLARLPQISHVERKRILLDLAQRERTLGNDADADGALIEAVAMDPGPEMLARFKELVPGPPGRVRTLISAMLTKAEAQGTTPTPAWLLELGHAELGDGKLREAAQTYEAARAHGPYAFDATFALGRAHLELGNYAEAAGALRQLMTLDGGLGLPYVRLLHEALQRSGAHQEAFVAKELLALAHDGGDAINMALAQRRFAATGTGDVLGARGLRNMVMPLLGHHPIWDVGAAATELAGKFARVPLTELGATTRDRVKPRAVHPLRPIFEHFQRVFDLSEIELAVAAGCRDAGIALENETWIVVPSALAEWPEPMVNATFARLFTRVALGVPWWGPFEPRAVLANLVAFARQVAPRFSALPSERLEPFVLDAEDRARRSMDRKRRKALEEHMTLQHAAALTETEFHTAVSRTEARCAFLMSGDVRAVLHVLASGDPFVLEALRAEGQVGLAKVLSQPLLRDLVAFAMSPEASRIRRNLGTTFG
jgi:tetratricopeptide (TPR) repeat protein